MAFFVTPPPGMTASTTKELVVSLKMQWNFNRRIRQQRVDFCLCQTLKK